jgi:hypothetical protein
MLTEALITMTRQFKTNLNCGNCVAAVTPFLNADPAIQSWRVDTTVPEKILTVEGDNTTQESVGALVARAGFKVLGEIEEPHGHEASQPADEPGRSYYPLVLILFFLLGVTALVEVRLGNFEWNRAMRHFMAGFFLVFSFFKLLNLRAFADSYSAYDVIAMRWRPYGFIYPLIELGLGAAYVVDVWPLATNLVALIVMAVSAVGVVQSLLERRQIRCACLGAVFNLPMSYVTLLEDLLMAGMALAMVLAHFFAT